MAWLPDREELAAIWRVLGTLVRDVADLARRVTALERRGRD